MVTSLMVSAYFACFTHSSGVLFEARDADESVASATVVEGCKEHPTTDEFECEQHVKCFEQEGE